MSIDAAAKELTKEIDRLLKEAARLTKLRDELVPGSASEVPAIARKKATKKAAKKVVAKKAASPKAVAPKKRTLSVEAKKRISDANKKRWAEKKKAEAAK